MLGGFLELGDVHVANARLHQEVDVDGVTRNLVAGNDEVHRLGGALAGEGPANLGALGSFEQIGDFGGAHVVRGLAIDGNDHVTGVDTGAVGGRTREGQDH